MMRLSNLLAAVSVAVLAAACSLDKTWTTAGQETQAGSQVLCFSALPSPVSRLAEGKGFEPSTGCPAPDFESGC